MFSRIALVLLSTCAASGLVGAGKSIFSLLGKSQALFKRDLKDDRIAKQNARILEFTSKKENLENMLSHFNSELNALTGIVEKTDSSVYGPAHLYEYEQEETQRRTLNLTLQIAAVFRSIYDQLYPSRVNEPAIIVAYNDDDKLLHRAILKYRQFMPELRSDTSSECATAARLLDKILKIDGETSSAALSQDSGNIVRELSLSRRLQLVLQQEEYYRKRLRTLEKFRDYFAPTAK